jgi:CTP:molybdopterin cytidylyltransferase MocA
MSGEWDVVIPAAGSISDDYARVIGTPYRALARLGADRRPVLQTVVDSFRASGLVRRIIVIAQDAVASEVDSVDLWLPPTGNGATNTLRGLAALEAPTVPALVCTSDLPFLTGPTVRDFVSKCRPDADICLGLVSAQAYGAAFPDAPQSVWVTLRDIGPVTIGGLFCVRPSCLMRQERMLIKIFESRKSQWMMARLLGPLLLCRWALRSLTLAALQARGEAVLSARAQVVRDVAPQLSFDIDTEDDYTYADACLRQSPRADAAGQV